MLGKGGARIRAIGEAARRAIGAARPQGPPVPARQGQPEMGGGSASIARSGWTGWNRQRLSPSAPAAKYVATGADHAFSSSGNRGLSRPPPSRRFASIAAPLFAVDPRRRRSIRRWRYPIRPERSATNGCSSSPARTASSRCAKRSSCRPRRRRGRRAGADCPALRGVTEFSDSLDDGQINRRCPSLEADRWCSRTAGGWRLEDYRFDQVVRRSAVTVGSSSPRADCSPMLLGEDAWGRHVR